MRYWIVLFLTTVTLVAHGQLQFDSTSVNGALKLATEQDKLVFIYGYTPWCEPCEEMEAYTFTDLEVANFWKQNFISLALNLEDYPGLELMDKYGIHYFPGFLFIDGDGEVVHRGCAGMDAAEFLYFGRAALSDSANLAQFQKRYADGERSTDFLYQYLDLQEALCLDAEKFATEYLQGTPINTLSEETPWAIFATYHWDIFSPEFSYLLENQQQFEKAIGKEAVNAKIYDTFLSVYQEVYQSEELHDFGMRALLNAIEHASFDGADTLKLMMKLHYEEYREDWGAYAATAIEFVSLMRTKDPNELGELAWNFYLFVTDRGQLEIAAGWAKEAVNQMPEPSLIDTYAALQFKLGNRKQAVLLEEKALELARELGEDTSHYQYQLSKFSGQ